MVRDTTVTLKMGCVPSGAGALAGICCVGFGTCANSIVAVLNSIVAANFILPSRCLTTHNHGARLMPRFLKSGDEAHSRVSNKLEIHAHHHACTAQRYRQDCSRTVRKS